MLLRQRENGDVAPCMSVFASLLKWEQTEETRATLPCLVLLFLAKRCHHTFLSSPRLVLIGLFQYFPYAGWRNETALASQQTFNWNRLHIKANHLEGQVKLRLIGVNCGQGFFPLMLILLDEYVERESLRGSWAAETLKKKWIERNKLCFFLQTCWFISGERWIPSLPRCN